MRIDTVLFGVGLLFSLSATAVEPVKKNSNVFSNVPFMMNDTKISKDFRGVDPIALYQSLLKNPAPIKKEFETTNEYNDRHDAWLNKKIIGNLSKESTIAFVFSPANIPDGQASYKYDADTLKMTFSLNPRGLYGGKRMLKVFSRHKNLGSYIGQNAFGAKKQISKYEVTNFCIDGVDEGTIEFPVDLHKAYLEKSLAKFILIGRLKYPYSNLSEDYEAPKFDSPYDEHSINHIINFAVKEIWVLSGVTGRILYKPGDDEIIGDGPPTDYNYDSNNNNALHRSIWNNQTKKSLILIGDKNVNFNEINKFGATPLHLAVAKENLKVILALIAAGANSEIKDQDGATPLMDAKKSGNLEIINALEMAGKK